MWSGLFPSRPSELAHWARHPWVLTLAFPVPQGAAPRYGYHYLEVPYHHRHPRRHCSHSFHRQPAITGFDWPFTPSPCSSQYIATYTGSGLWYTFRCLSPWQRLAHPVSGLRPLTLVLPHLVFTAPSPLRVQLLPVCPNSPTHYAKGTQWESSLRLPSFDGRLLQALPSQYCYTRLRRDWWGNPPSSGP